MNLHTARITRYDFDELRFDVTTNETIYYLRGENKDDVARWLEALENTKVGLGLSRCVWGARVFHEPKVHAD